MAKYLGLLLVIAGATTLIMSYLLNMTRHNGLLLASLLLVLAGTVTFVAALRHEGRY